MATGPTEELPQARQSWPRSKLRTSGRDSSGGARGSNVETAGGPDALSTMELPIAFAVVFLIGFGVGYAVREQKSRMRRRRYYRGDSTGS
jgi:hypothetical protein